MDHYDWPLLGITLLLALSITLALRGLRIVLGLLTSLRPKLGPWRQPRPLVAANPGNGDI